MSTFFSDFNTLFRSVVQHNLAREQSLRIVVADTTFPQIGFSVTLLVDYKPACHPVDYPSFYAVAAVVLFEGMSAHAYQRICTETKRLHPELSGSRNRAAEGLAAKLMLQSGHAVCVFRDDAVLEQLRDCENHRYGAFDSDAVETLAAMSVFAEDRDLLGAQGPISAARLKSYLGDKLGRNFCCISEEDVQAWTEAGEHPSRRHRAA